MFVAYEVSLELVRSLRPIVDIVERNDRDLADQLKRAASSVVLNLAEGARSMKGNKPKHYAIAHGSAHEVRGALDTAIAWGWLGDTTPATRTAAAMLDRLMRLLWGLTHPRLGA